jgi:hypothetical protein
LVKKSRYNLDVISSSSTMRIDSTSGADAAADGEEVAPFSE